MKKLLLPILLSLITLGLNSPVNCIKINIWAQGPRGTAPKSVSLDVQPTETIQSIKQKVSAAAGLPQNTPYNLSGMIKLSDQKTVADYNFEENMRLTLQLPPLPRSTQLIQRAEYYVQQLENFQLRLPTEEDIVKIAGNKEQLEVLAMSFLASMNPLQGLASLILELDELTKGNKLSAAEVQSVQSLKRDIPTRLSKAIMTYQGNAVFQKYKDKFLQALTDFFAEMAARQPIANAPILELKDASLGFQVLSVILGGQLPSPLAAHLAQVTATLKAQNITVTLPFDLTVLQQALPQNISTPPTQPVPAGVQQQAPSPQQRPLLGADPRTWSPMKKTGVFIAQPMQMVPKPMPAPVSSGVIKMPSQLVKVATP